MMNHRRSEHPEDLVAVERLTAGQTFHKTVQSAFLTGLVGASGFKERQWRLIRGSRGRVDLAVEVDGDEQTLVVIEIKGTDWDAIPADRVMRNLRRHLRQLQAYLVPPSKTWKRAGGRASWVPCSTLAAQPVPQPWL
jgi:hypothetical protein